jgi:hypothetical protein
MMIKLTSLGNPNVEPGKKLSGCSLMGKGDDGFFGTEAHRLCNSPVISGRARRSMQGEHLLPDAGKAGAGISWYVFSY